MKKIKNKIIYLYIIMFFISFLTICFGITKNKVKDTDNYSDYSKEWYAGEEKANLSEIYKYKEVTKKLTNIKENTQIYLNVKSINISIFIEDECIYKYQKYDKGLFGKTPGSYFIKVDLKQEYNNKNITLKMDKVYNDKSGKITEIYIGDSSDIIKKFISDHLMGILVSTVIIFIGSILMIIYISFRYNKKRYNRVLYLGLFALITGIFLFTDSKFLQALYGYEYLYHMISELSMLLVVVPLMLFVGECYKSISNKLIIRIICFLSLINFVVCYILSIFNIKDLHELLNFTHLTYILAIMYILYLCIKSLINKRNSERYHTVGFFVICIGVIIDIVLLYKLAIIETTFFTRLGILLFLCLEGFQFSIDFLKIYRQQERISLLHKLAYEDGLTELLNRKSFMNDMDELKNSKDGLIAVFDINDLKIINDKYGHSEGDNTIVVVSNTLKEILLPIGKCYRIGGDEFVFISQLPNIEEKFKKACKKIKENLNLYNKASNKEYKVDISIGHSIIDKKVNIEKAFKIADDNMYKNKKEIKGIK